MEKNKDRIIFDLLHKYIDDMGLKDKMEYYGDHRHNWTYRARTSAIWACLNDYNPAFPSYDTFFDKAITWDSTDEGYEFWAAIQLRFYYCLCLCGLGSASTLNDFYERLNTYQGGEDLSKYSQLLWLCRKEIKRKTKHL